VIKKIEKSKNITEKIDEKFEKNSKIKNFFKNNFSDSKILQKNFSDKLKNLFPDKKFLKFLIKIKKYFSDKKINFDQISENLLNLNLKDFDETFLECEKILKDKIKLEKNFLELNIFTENEKKYLEIINCDLILDFWDEKKVLKITLQSDEFLKMIW